MELVQKPLNSKRKVGLFFSFLFFFGFTFFLFVIIRRKTIKHPPYFKPNRNIVQQSYSLSTSTNTQLFWPSSFSFVWSYQDSVFSVVTNKVFYSNYFSAKCSIRHIGPTRKYYSRPAIKPNSNFFSLF